MLSLERASAAPSWEDRALGRSLAGARAKSGELLTRLMEAARGLAAETGNPAFTVQQVVGRANVSLKTFYRYFASKDELLVALFEEDNHLGARTLEALIARHDEPLERLRACITGLFSIVASSGDRAYMAVLVREHLRLAESHPEELRGALAPFLELLTAELASAAGAGKIRARDPARDAVTIFHLLVGHLHALILGQVDHDPADVGEYLWQFCQGALQARPLTVRRTREAM